VARCALTPGYHLSPLRGEKTIMAKIHYARVDEFWRKEQKYAYLDEKTNVGNVEWQELQPDAKGNWLGVVHGDDFDALLPLAVPQNPSEGFFDVQSVFRLSSNGVQTNRDAWVYNFNRVSLRENITKTLDVYNEHVYRWQKLGASPKHIDSFVTADHTKIKWSSALKQHLAAGLNAAFDEQNIGNALYRPFTPKFEYFDPLLTHRRGRFHLIFPSGIEGDGNVVICSAGVGNRMEFGCLATNRLPPLDLAFEKSLCFPFYTYNEDGTNRRENITDWALEQFRSHYSDKSITKWDIFHYVYAVLHHPLYRERYAANLKRELPRIPFAPDFRAFADIGKQLAEIHVNYEQQPEHPLERIEKPGAQLDWRVERMKLSKDKRSLIYNDFLTLSGIPPEVFAYRLGNRSALEWIIDQYQVSTDKRSGITNDPNRDDDPQYIVRLVGQVISVSMETVKLVQSLSTKPLLPETS
jgi:predicted helicase